MESIKLEQNSLNAIPHVSNFYHGSLFSGIGGFDLAAQWNGINNLFQVEIDEFCQKVLSKNFPETAKFKDIRNFNAKEYYGQITILSGGFPCQPFSVAGKQKGAEDERYLWEEMLRVIREIQPKWIVAENVYGLITNQNGMVLNKVFTDLENSGYEIQPFIIPACGKDAPHKRERIWIVANSNSERCNNEQKENRKSLCYEKQYNSIEEQKRDFEQCRIEQSNINVTNSDNIGVRYDDRQEQMQLTRSSWQSNWYEIATKLCRVDDGVSDRVDRLKSLGNAIVPQIAYEIFRNIIEVELSFQ